MPRASIRLRLDQRACDLARESRRAAAPALHPEARLILQRAAPGPPGSGTCIVACTKTEAEALLDHFSTLADTLNGLGDPDAAVCATARDSIRRALAGARA
jgi:hypothetical protein